MHYTTTSLLKKDIRKGGYQGCTLLLITRKRQLIQKRSINWSNFLNKSQQCVKKLLSNINLTPCELVCTKNNKYLQEINIHQKKF